MLPIVTNIHQWLSRISISLLLFLLLLLLLLVLLFLDLLLLVLLLLLVFLILVLLLPLLLILLPTIVSHSPSHPPPLILKLWFTTYRHDNIWDIFNKSNWTTRGVKLRALKITGLNMVMTFQKIIFDIWLLFLSHYFI